MEDQAGFRLLEVGLVNPYLAPEDDAALASLEHLEYLGKPVAAGAFRVHVGQRRLRQALVRGEVYYEFHPFRYRYLLRVEHRAGYGRELPPAALAEVFLDPELRGAVFDAFVGDSVPGDRVRAAVEEGVDELDLLFAWPAVFLLVPFGDGGFGQPADGAPRAGALKAGLQSQRPGFAPSLVFSLAVSVLLGAIAETAKPHKAMTPKRILFPFGTPKL